MIQNIEISSVLRFVAGSFLISALAYAAILSMDGETVRELPIQSIAVIEPPPKPVEPEEIEIEQPEPELEDLFSEQPMEIEPIEPLPGDDLDDSLGVDAEGSGAGDGFGLTGKRGGRSIIGMESGDGGSGDIERIYAGQIKHALEGLFAQSDRLRKQEFVAILALWVDEHGVITQAAMENSTGKHAVDRAIVGLLDSGMAQVGPPPRGIRLPIRIRLRSGSRG